MALIALHHLVTVKDAKIIIAASSRQQATNLFEYAERFARELDDPHVAHRHLVLRWCPDPDDEKAWTRSLEIWASDHRKLHGTTYSMAVIDELQAHADQRLYVAIGSGLHKRPGAQLLVISTAGQGVDSPLGLLRTRALGLPTVKRRGVVTEAKGAGLRFIEWSLADDADVNNPRVVKRANPASWITVEQLARAREALPDLDHRRFVANQWTERAGHWLPAGAWQAAVGQPAFTDGEDIWIGVDIGGERSNSAIVWVNAALHVGAWIGEGDRALFDAIAKVRTLASQYNVRELVYDPWRFGQAAREFESEGLTCVEFNQTDQRMAPASMRLRDAIVERRLTLPPDPRLAEHSANAVARHSRRGWRLDRPSRTECIDGMVALAMAVERVDCQPADVELLGWI